jgi:hypothetical protein
MDVEIKPEPTPEEREAIEAAMRRLMHATAQPTAYTSAWRKTGLREALDPYAAARPRKSFGATRA